MSEELKPCPFCGQIDNVFQYDSDGFVDCIPCEAYADEGVVSAGITSWNSRPIEDMAQDKLKQITAYLELLEGWVESGEPSRDTIRQWAARALRVAKGEKGISVTSDIDAIIDIRDILNEGKNNEKH